MKPFFSFLSRLLCGMMVFLLFHGYASAQSSAEVLFQRKIDRLILDSFRTNTFESLKAQLSNLQSLRPKDRRVMIFQNRLANARAMLPLLSHVSASIILDDESAFMSWWTSYRVAYKHYFPIDPVTFSSYRLPDRLTDRFLLFLPDGSYRLTDTTASLQPASSYRLLQTTVFDYFDTNDLETFLTPKSTIYLIKEGIVIPDKSLFLSGTFYDAYDLSQYVMFRLPENNIWFSQNYQWASFGSGIIFSGITNRKEVFASLQDELYFASGSTFLRDLSAIRLVTDRIIRNAHNDEEKIRLIFTFIARYLRYDEATKKYLETTTGTGIIISSSPNLHSWLASFRKRVAVCDGYSRLFLYMLSFAHIDDASLVLGEVEQRGRKNPHAWNRIGDRYYDVTFASGNPTDRNSYFAQESLSGYVEQPQMSQISTFEKLKNLQN